MDINGFLAILFNNMLKIKPTPTPTPANTLDGILDARYLKPSNIINAKNKACWAKCVELSLMHWAR